jgi:hypothetical protein
LEQPLTLKIEKEKIVTVGRENAKIEKEENRRENGRILK